MGQFKKGVSGNPKGRPRGIIDKRQKLQLALEEKAEELLKIIIERAMKGDTQMQRVLLGRLIPPAKPESSRQFICLPEGSLSEQADAVIQAVGKGEFPTSNAHELLSAMSLSLKIKETEELEQRVGKLEENVSVKWQG